MTFSYDLSTDIGEVRLMLGDYTEGNGVRPDGSNFSDEELQVFLDHEDEIVERAVARGCEALAAEYARHAGFTSVGPRKHQLSDRAKMFSEMATRYRKTYGVTPAGGSAARAGVMHPARRDGYSERYGE